MKKIFSVAISVTQIDFILPWNLPHSPEQKVRGKGFNPLTIESEVNYDEVSYKKVKDMLRQVPHETWQGNWFKCALVHVIIIITISSSSRYEMSDINNTLTALGASFRTL